MDINKEAMLAWAEALESGDYAQTKGGLRDKDGFCCLGVACEIAVKHGVIDPPIPPADSWGSARWYSYDCNTAVLPLAVKRWLGVNGSAPEVGGLSFPEMNDRGGWDFNAIAAKVRILGGLPPREVSSVQEPEASVPDAG